MWENPWLIGLSYVVVSITLVCLVRRNRRMCRSRERELQTALETTRVALDHAERAARVKTDFLRLVSHELRTPLTAFILYLEALRRDREGTLSPRQREIVHKLAGSSHRLVNLIESLLEYARLQGGCPTLHPEPTDLAVLAVEAVEELRPQADHKGLALRLTVPPGLPSLDTDPRLVRLVLGNLLGNAVKYTDQGAVEVVLGEEKGLHRVAVRDTGPGIPPDRQEVIFEPFEHLEPVRQKHTPGIGLGLALVQEMVTGLGGRIELTSEVGVGSTFTLVLPSFVVPPSGGGAGRRLLNE